MLEPISRVWQVGALCRAIADALDARFNALLVRGEISGFSRASSGHRYFSLKDSGGQIRCVMFKRAASLADFSPRDGDLVDVRGRLAVYEQRGDLQLIVEAMDQAGPGASFEQFLRLKARLEAEGLFDAARKRPMPPMPRGIGVVTSLGAAALRDVISVLQRRVPHVAVVVAAASVQGAGAPGELAAALNALYRLADSGASPLDAILLVRGGGAMEDLWAFNDETLARVIARSPVPVITGVGHETDFTIADFVADLRAPTPTAAAELAAVSRDVWFDGIDAIQEQLQNAIGRRLDAEIQRLDAAADRLGRPSARTVAHRMALVSIARRLRTSSLSQVIQGKRELIQLSAALPDQIALGLERMRTRLARAELRLGLLDPALVLRRGYTRLEDEDGHTITSVHQTRIGQTIQATLSDGKLKLRVPM